MTGFAFYSCEDVVDNPAQDPAQSWNYSVSVKFEAFTGVAYQAPTTLYVFNEDMSPMGTITTDATPSFTTYVTYAGTLQGAIGNNLIIVSQSNEDCAKQDGTLASIAKNGLVQTATVPIKIYNANSGTLTTASAKMENTSAIVEFKTNELFAGDKLTLTAKDQAFEISINEEFDPTVGILYAAVPATGTDKGDITIAATSKDGFMRGYTLKGETYPVTKGVITNYSAATVPFEKTGVDLTVWDAYQRETNDITGNTTFNQWINDDKSFIITQSGEKAVNTDVALRGSLDADVAATLNNIRLEEGRYFEVYNGAKFDITLIGANKFDMLNLNSPYTKKGEGTWEFDRLNVGGKVTTTTDTNLEIDKNTVDYFAEYTFNEDITLKELNVYQGAVVNIADGKKVKITDENGGLLSIAQEGTLNVGEGSTLDVYSASQKNTIASINGGKLNIKKGATVSITGYKDNTALSIYSSNTWGNQNPNSSVKIGEGASLTLKGGIENSLGSGLYIQNFMGGSVAIELEKDAKLIAEGIDKDGAISCYAQDWRSTTSENARPTTITFNIAEGAEVVANETAEALGFYYYGSAATASTPASVLSITGKGTFEAKSAKGEGMVLNGKVNITGVNVEVTGGTNKPAVSIVGKPALNLIYSKDSTTKFTATSGMTTSPICILDVDNDKELATFSETGFTDTKEGNVRVITPKAPAK